MRDKGTHIHCRPIRPFALASDLRASIKAVVVGLMIASVDDIGKRHQPDERQAASGSPMRSGY